MSNAAKDRVRLWLRLLKVVRGLEQELRDFLAPQLARIKMPRLFDFRPELPREANGKLYKRELRDEYLAMAEEQTEQA